MSRIYTARHRNKNRSKLREYWRRRARESREIRPEHHRQLAISWRTNNRSKLKSYQDKAERRRNTDNEGAIIKRKASRAAYRQRNPHVTKVGWERWKEQHPERFIHFVRLHALKRYARKCAAPGSHTLEQWLQRVALYGWCCAYCRKELNVDTLRKDHVKPLVVGGADWPSNLVPACNPCNCKKNSKRWIPRLP